MTKKQQTNTISFEIFRDADNEIERIVGTPATCENPEQYITVGRGYSTLPEMKSAVEALKKYAAETFIFEGDFHIYNDLTLEGRTSKTLGLVSADQPEIADADLAHSQFVKLVVPGYGRVTLKMPTYKANNKTHVGIVSPWLSIRMVSRKDGKLFNTDLGEDAYTKTYNLHMYLEALHNGQPIHVWATREIGRNGQVFDIINQKVSGLEPFLCPTDKNGKPVAIDAERIRKEDRAVAEAYWQEKNAKRQGYKDQWKAEQSGAITDATGVTVVVNGQKMDAIDVPAGTYRCIDDNGEVSKAKTKVQNDAHRRGLKYLATANGGINLITAS